MKSIIVRIYILLFIFSILLSCHSSLKDAEFNSFPITKNLRGEIIEIDQKFKSCEVFVYEKYIVLSSIPGSKYLILVLDNKTLNIIGKAGKIGKGPYEIPTPGPSIIDRKNGIIWYEDIVRRRLWKFDIDSIVCNELYESITSIEMPKVFALFNFHCINDSLFAFTGNNPDTLLSFFNINGKDIPNAGFKDWIRLYNSEEISMEARNYMAYYYFTYNDHAKRYAIAYRFSDVILILDLKGNILKKIFGPSRINHVPSYSENQIITNYKLISDNRYIYSLYLGKSRFDLETGREPQFPNNINVLNWVGEPVMQFITNHNILSFDLDTTTNRLITYSADCDAIVIYDLGQY